MGSRFGRAAITLLGSSLLATACAAPADSGAGKEDAHTGERAIVNATAIADSFHELVLVNASFPDGHVEPCSGALLNDHVALTAAHCIIHDGVQSSQIGVIAPYAAGKPPQFITNVAMAHPNKDVDVALVFLMLPVDGSPFPTTAQAAAADGTNAIVEGRTNDTAVSKTDLFSRPTTVNVRDSATYQGNVVTQCGDSGGPLFRANTHEILAIVTGITDPLSANDCNSPTATSVSVYTRIDPGSDVSNWVKDNSLKPTADIALQSGASATPTDDCNGITYDGVCDGAILSYCDAGVLQTIDCGGAGGTCGSDGASGNDCLYDAAPSSCGSVSYAGQCDGSMLSWCHAGLQQLDCADYGKTCGYNDQQGYYDCL